MGNMKRNREYGGQSHTDHGKRGKQKVKGLTMRDIRDCYVRAVLLSAGHIAPKLYDEALKGEDAKLGGGDLYGFDLDKLDPIAIAQNLTCEIERMMGIFPNIPKLPSDGKQNIMNRFLSFFRGIYKHTFDLKI